MRGNNPPDNNLPPRLFATDRYPNGRLNIYSKPDYLAFIRHVLRDTKEFDYIRASCFGRLFDLHARQCPLSGKLIHAFLTRQLVCEDRYTLWPVYAGEPVRFGLQEFGTITGLPCGAFPVGYSPLCDDGTDEHKDPLWIKLIGKKKFTTIADLRQMLESDIHMPGWKKLRLALIIIVDGVLIAHKQKTRPTLRYVRMVDDVDAFCSHPWGRESFLKTIECMKPPLIPTPRFEDPTDVLVQQLKQESFRLRGFPLALQLLVFRAIPKLQTTIAAPVDSLTIMDLNGPHLPVYPPISYIDILRIEAQPLIQRPQTWTHLSTELPHQHINYTNQTMFRLKEPNRSATTNQTLGSLRAFLSIISFYLYESAPQVTCVLNCKQKTKSVLIGNRLVV